ncbi:MAG: hypothetical protein ACE5R6_01215 [Candidatus Heimdallarchaeota archaeon]
MQKLRRISVTITEEQFAFLLNLRNARIPTTVFMRSLLQQHILGYDQSNRNDHLIEETTIIIKKNRKRMVPLMRPEQKRTVEMAGSALGAELKNALKSITPGNSDTDTNSSHLKEDPPITFN